MDEFKTKIINILGEDRLKDIAKLDTDDDEQKFNNSKEILCQCNALILKPNNAKLTVLPDSMRDLEKDLLFLRSSDDSFKNLVRGCYWLVDDMYKFEQMGFTKEVNAENQAKLARHKEAYNVNGDSTSSQISNSNIASPSAPNGLRYLLCAECNICPLGWFNPLTKESYLYVW